MTNRTPLLVAIVVLLAPVLYVGSYFALVMHTPLMVEPTKGHFLVRGVHYRWGGEYAAFVFEPIIQLDHKLRPQYWLQLTERGWKWDPDYGR